MESKTLIEINKTNKLSQTDQKRREKAVIHRDVTESPIRSTKKATRINEFSKVVGYKVNLQKSAIFL